MKAIQKTMTLAGILIAASLNTVQAGISGCFNSNTRTMDEKILVHSSGESKATIKLVKADYNCELFQGERLRIEISFKKLSDTPIPNHGFLSATINSFSPSGHQVHQRHLERSAFMAIQYPFNAEASDVFVDLKEFGSVRLIH